MSSSRPTPTLAAAAAAAGGGGGGRVGLKESIFMIVSGEKEWNET